MKPSPTSLSTSSLLLLLLLRELPAVVFLLARKIELSLSLFSLSLPLSRPKIYDEKSEYLLNRLAGAGGGEEVSKLLASRHMQAYAGW